MQHFFSPPQQPARGRYSRNTLAYTVLTDFAVDFNQTVLDFNLGEICGGHLSGGIQKVSGLCAEMQR